MATWWSIQTRGSTSSPTTVRPCPAPSAGSRTSTSSSLSSTASWPRRMSAEPWLPETRGSRDWPPSSLGQESQLIAKWLTTTFRQKYCIQVQCAMGSLKFRLGNFTHMFLSFSFNCHSHTIHRNLRCPPITILVMRLLKTFLLKIF